MNTKVLLETGMLLCQSTQKKVINLIREGMNAEVQAALGLSRKGAMPKLPYSENKHDAPVIVALKQLMNHLYHSEHIFEACLVLYSQDVSTLSNQVRALKPMLNILLSSLQAAENAARLTDNMTSLGLFYQDIFQTEFDALVKIRKLFNEKEDLGVGHEQIAVQFKVKLNELKAGISSLDSLLNLSGDLSSYLDELVKIYPEQLRNIEDDLYKIKETIFNGRDVETFETLVLRHLTVLTQLEYQGGLRPGILVEPYKYKLNQMIEESENIALKEQLKGATNKEADKVQHQLYKEAMANFYLESAHEAQIKERFAIRFFELLRKLPTDLYELRASLVNPQKGKMLEELKTCYAHIKDEVVFLFPDIDKAFMAVIQVGPLSKENLTWSMKDLLDKKSSILALYQYHYKNESFKYRNVQREAISQIPANPEKKLWNKREVQYQYEQRLHHAKSRHPVLIHELREPKEKTESWMKSPHTFHQSAQKIRAQRESIIQMLKDKNMYQALGLHLSKLPYSYRKNDKPLVQVIKALLNGLYHSEKALNAYEKVLKQKTSVLSGLKVIWHRFRAMHFTKKSLDDLFRLKQEVLNTDLRQISGDKSIVDLIKYAPQEGVLELASKLEQLSTHLKPEHFKKIQFFKTAIADAVKQTGEGIKLESVKPKH